MSTVTIRDVHTVILDAKWEDDKLSLSGNFHVRKMLFFYHGKGFISAVTTGDNLREINPTEFHADYIQALVMSDMIWLAGNTFDEFAGVFNPRMYFKKFDDFNQRRIESQIAFLERNIKGDPHKARHKMWEIQHGIKQAIEEQTPKPGYVYLVRALIPENHYKIGFSKNPIKRIESMGVKLPFPLETLKLIPTNHCERAEEMLHLRYEEKRLSGEWFALSDADVQEICALEHITIEGIRS